MLKWFFLLSGCGVFYFLIGFWGDSHVSAFHIFSYGVSWRIFLSGIFLLFASLRFKGK